MTYYPNRSPERAGVMRLIGAFDAFGIALPKPVIEARRADTNARSIAEQAAARETANMLTLTEALADRLGEIARTTDKLPDDLAADIVTAEQEQRRLAILNSAAQLNVEKSDLRLAHSIRDNADAVHKVLVKEFETVIGDGKHLAHEVKGYNLANREAFLDAPDHVRIAFGQFESAGRRLAAITEARYQLRRLTGEPKVDFEGRFALVMDPWNGKMPVNVTDAQRLHWLATGPCSPWLPTVQQQDDAERVRKESLQGTGRKVTAATV